MQPITTWKHPDQELIKQFLEGDKKAFDQLYDQYAPVLYGIICSFTADKKKAGDILQQSFISLWQYRSALPLQDSLLNYMIRTVRKMSFGVAEYAQSGEHVESISPSENQMAPDYVHMDTAYIRKTVADPADISVQDNALNMIYMQGRSPQEVATYLNITPEEVRRIVRCAINRLKVKNR